MVKPSKKRVRTGGVNFVSPYPLTECVKRLERLNKQGYHVEVVALDELAVRCILQTKEAGIRIDMREWAGGAQTYVVAADNMPREILRFGRMVRREVVLMFVAAIVLFVWWILLATVGHPALMLVALLGLTLASMAFSTDRERARREAQRAVEEKATAQLYDVLVAAVGVE